jgi:hypothetical protein
MRAVPEALAARIESGAASLCHAWILTRADGARLGFTDHDADVAAGEVICRAASGWTAGASDAAAGFAPGLSAALGALDDEAIAPADLEAGLYDGAVVECRRIDWSAPALFVVLWTARIARLKRDGGAFTAELEGPLAQLDRVAGRGFGRLCDAVLGDARCGVDLAAFPGATCDKRWRACVDQFANGLNFRGFPTMPGEDFLTLYPSDGERQDGTSRR